MTLTILSILAALIPFGIWLYKRNAAPTKQERFDSATATRQELEARIDRAMARNDANEVTLLTEELLRRVRFQNILAEDNTTADRRRAQIHPVLAALIVPMAALVIFTACASTPIVIPSDRSIAFINSGTVAPADGYLVPPARMQEILKALADKELELELQNTKEVSP